MPLFCFAIIISPVISMSLRAAFLPRGNPYELHYGLLRSARNDNLLIFGIFCNEIFFKFGKFTIFNGGTYSLH
jgi:hypothetical protein